jgi:hypothetical protein
MNSNTKYRVIKLLMYLAIGFAVAFVWHMMKSKQS